MKWHYCIRGDHTHVVVFMNGAQCGKLSFRNHEFAEVVEHCPWITFNNLEDVKSTQPSTEPAIETEI